MRAPLRRDEPPTLPLGGALCRPPAGAQTSANTGNHGVSDPAWRPVFRPTRVRRGRSRHAVSAGVDVAVGVDRDRARRCLLPQMSHLVLVRLPARFVTRSCGKDVPGRWPGASAKPGPPAITRSSLDLCSAPSRRVASLRPHEMYAAAALTAPARRLCPGSCVMADREWLRAASRIHPKTFRPDRKVELLHALICRSHIRSPRSTCTA